MEGTVSAMPVATAVAISAWYEAFGTPPVRYWAAMSLGLDELATALAMSSGVAVVPLPVIHVLTAFRTASLGSPEARFSGGIVVRSTWTPAPPALLMIRPWKSATRMRRLLSIAAAD